jgi:ureidoacrylate peracid hydrolase
MTRDQVPYTFESWMDGAYHRPVAVPREDTALLVIDMQNAFLRPEHDLGLGGELSLFAAAIPGCVRLVDAAREAGVPVIFARFAFLPGGGDRQLVRGIRRGEPHADILVAGTPGADIIEELTPRPGEVVIDKSRPSVFGGTRLEPLLSAQGIKNLVLCGVTTNVCVESTARDAAHRDFDTFVVEDAAGEAEKSRHWHSLYTVDFTFGTVTDVREVEASWGVSDRGPTGHTYLREFKSEVSGDALVAS